MSYIWLGPDYLGWQDSFSPHPGDTRAGPQVMRHQSGNCLNEHPHPEHLLCAQCSLWHVHLSVWHLFSHVALTTVYVGVWGLYPLYDGWRSYVSYLKPGQWRANTGPWLQTSVFPSPALRPPAAGAPAPSAGRAHLHSARPAVCPYSEGLLRIPCAGRGKCDYPQILRDFPQRWDSPEFGHVVFLLTDPSSLAAVQKEGPGLHPPRGREVEPRRWFKS